jgi:uncharacterized protein
LASIARPHPSLARDTIAIMRVVDGELRLAPTDLSSFLSCRHRTGLDLAAARGEIGAPFRADPFAEMLRRHGEAHERRYVESLRAQGLRVVDLGAMEGTEPTVEAMRSGAEVITQAALGDGRGWQGRADVLRRVDQSSALGSWSYEVHDTKLARDTRAGTVLQLCAYSDFVAAIQGRQPALFHVIAPSARHAPAHSMPAQPQPQQGDLFAAPRDEFQIASFRVDDYAAYHRTIQSRLEALVRAPAAVIQQQHYPEPVESCELCRWQERCDARRRADDHLSLVAQCRRSQRVELVGQGYDTLAAAAAMPVPVAFTPSRGSRETFTRLGHQARVQFEQRTRRIPIAEPLTIEAGEGLCRLPAPSPGDLFLDLEGARFAREDGREFLFGVGGGGRSAEAGENFQYQAWWALDDEEEKRAFEAVVDLIIARWAGDPGMHVYHFNHYEPTAFKKLMGRHVTRGDAMDRLLRAERFVDLYPIVRQAVRAGVESYSIKQLEQYFGFARRVELRTVREPLVAVELALESDSADAIAPEIRAAVQGYNEDDCRSAQALRNWLESIRDRWIAGGVDVPRPADTPSPEPTPRVAALQQDVDALRARLLDGLPAEASAPEHPDHCRWLLAWLIDWHKREENAEWWEYFRLKGMTDEELFEERGAVAGMVFVERVETVVGKHGRLTGSVIDRYRYPPQEVAVAAGDALHSRDVGGLGSVAGHERLARLIDIRKGRKTADVHPAAVFEGGVYGTETPQRSVMRLAEAWLAAGGTREHGGASDVSQGCGIALLRRDPPRLRRGVFAAGGGSAQDSAVRMATELDRTTLAIQGPPGAGKTFVGARMIRALVAAGRRVGVTALSHKVIRNLLDEVHAQASRAGETIRLGHKQASGDPEVPPVNAFDKDEDALEALRAREVDVVGGTQWLWADLDFKDAVDVLFVDEAGQMSLASVLAVSQAAGSLVLLGDPQQLDQPQKASHPDGVGISALRHVLGDADVMPADKGIFLPTTWRMSPALCRFTSELFYRGELQAEPRLAAQELRSTGAFDGSRLWLVPVDHDGNRNVSDEEVETVARVVASLCSPASKWVDEHGVERPLMPSDLRIVAPFNAQVTRLIERLQPLGVPIGTVDKFQGQTAAVVIYSMTTSRPEDAPRGMEFLYSLNRLNVATSRARCAAIVVASPRLFEPECRTPRQMRLANALCRFRELASVPCL